MQYKSSVGKLIIAFAISLLMLSSVALAGVPSKLPLQCYSSKQVTTYNSANGSRWGYISANVDLIQITQISGEWAYGSYPTSRGRISRWFRLSDIVPNLSFGNYDTGMYRASTAYRTEGGSSTIGSVYANDTVTVVYRGNNRSQVIYPVSGGYKLGWVNNNDIKPLSQPTPSSPNLYNLTAAYPMDGVYTLIPGCATNMNLSIYNDGTANKAQAVIYNAGYRNSSKWKIQRIGNSEWYYIIDVNSGKSLDNEAGRGANGNMISLWPEQGVCQRWRFWQVRNGVYVIQAYTNNQFVLDVAGADTRANTIVQLWPYNASPAQQWRLTKTQQSVTRPATNNTFQQYTKTAQRQTRAYATSSLSSVYGNEWVDKGDVVTVLEETSNAYKVRYPVRNGYKERWVNKNIFTVESVSSPIQPTPIGDVKSKLRYAVFNDSSARITCDFDGYVNTKGRHEGIDMVLYHKAPVYSAISGTVIRTGGDYNTVAIYDSTHDKTVIYLHFNSIAVSNGRYVSKGSLIGYQGSKGASASHVHLEVRNGRKTSVAKSVNDYTLDNPDPYSYWNSVL